MNLLHGGANAHHKNSMTEKEINIDRIHGFDAMRAIMMMLGLVLHASMTYSDIDYGAVWPLKDVNNTSHFFHVLIEYIHVFRMPAFFVIAGFFGALLFYKKNPKTMMSNRLYRIVIPFFVCLMLLWPMAVFAFNFSNLMMLGNEESLKLAFTATFPNGLIPQNTIHLWFLFYLAMISYLTCFIAMAFRNYDYENSFWKKGFDKLHGNLFITLIPFSVITFFTLVYMNSSSAITSAAFIPDMKTLCFYTVFYWYGWVLYLSRGLINIFMKHAWLMVVIGTLLFIVKMYFDMSDHQYGLYFAMYANALTCWLYIFASMGLFLIYASSGSYTLRYISDSAYWVYLVHLPLIAFISGLLAGWDISAFIKYVIVLSSATLICFITYHYWVRDTFIGQFLNGRKYPKTMPVKS